MKNRTYHPRGKRVHGYLARKHPLYATWTSMLSRCYNPNAKAYPNYGDRGVRVCEQWHHFENFAIDMGLKPSPHLTLERLDNGGDYCKDNCVWASRTYQCHNRRIFRNNTTGVTGVSRIENGFIARYRNNGKTHVIGRFDSIEEASAARNKFVKWFAIDPDAAAESVSCRLLNRNSSTKIRGVTEHQDGGYIVRATVGGIRKYLGYFKSLENAVEARNNAGC